MDHFPGRLGFGIMTESDAQRLQIVGSIQEGPKVYLIEGIKDEDPKSLSQVWKFEMK